MLYDEKETIEIKPFPMVCPVCRIGVYNATAF